MKSWNKNEYVCEMVVGAPLKDKFMENKLDIVMYNKDQLR